jgi:hypothetical protein
VSGRSVSVFSFFRSGGSLPVKRQNGQAFTEYIMAVALTALICMAGAKLFHAMLVQAYKNLAFILGFPIP